MAFQATANSPLIVEGQFDNNTTRNLKNVNAFLYDTVDATNVEADSIVLTIVDSEGTTQYTLTTISTPAIEMDETSLVYSVDEIDVTAFPSGDITITWTFELDSEDYEIVQTCEFEQVKNLILVEGQTTTLQDGNVTLDSSKIFSVRLVDGIGNQVDGYAARLAILDRNLGTVTYFDGTLRTAGSGLWEVTATLATGTYSADLNRYECYWEIQILQGGGYSEVYNSRQPLKIYTPTSSIQTGPICYNTNQSLRESFPGVDNLLSTIAVSQGEREVILNRKRQEIASIIDSQTRNYKRYIDRTLLETWANLETYRAILLIVHGFAKFSVKDGQLAELDKAINRIKRSLYGNVRTGRIGGRR